MDEIHFKSQGESMWMFGVMDAETRQIVACMTSQGINVRLRCHLACIRDAVATAGGRIPDVPISDGLGGI